MGRLPQLLWQYLQDKHPGLIAHFSLRANIKLTRCFFVCQAGFRDEEIYPGLLSSVLVLVLSTSLTFAENSDSVGTTTNAGSGCSWRKLQLTDYNFVEIT